MSKIEFIHLLVSSNFASQFEAEQYTVAAGSHEWVYFNPFTKYKAHNVGKQIKSNRYLFFADTYVPQLLAA